MLVCWQRSMIMSWVMKIGVNVTTRSSVSASRLLSSLNILMSFHIVNLQCIDSHALANAYSVLTHKAERARWSTSERRPFYPAFGMPFPVPSCWASALFGTGIVAVCVDCARHGGHVCPACIMRLPYSNCQCRVYPAMVGGIS